MKVLNYQVHNVLRVADADLTLDGRHLFLVGGTNESGKTSSLRALQMALCGRSGSDYPEVALKEGEREGWVKVQLSGEEEELHDARGFSVELYLSRKQNGTVVEKFRVVDADGDEAPEPRTLLQRLYGLRAFDPLTFEKLTSPEKRKLLTELLGLDLSDLDNQRKKLFDQRAEVNRDGVRMRSRWEDMAKHDDAPKECIDPKALSEELTRRQKVNRANQILRDKLARAEIDLAKEARAVERTEAKIAELQALLDMQRKGHAAVLETQQALTNEVGLLKDEDELGAVSELTKAQVVNRKVIENQERAKVGKELESLRAKAVELTTKMAEIDQQKHDKLASADWPVPGLGISDDGVLFNDLPFEQLCKSKRILVSAMVGIAMNPTLRLMVCQDGSDLGNEALAALEELLKEHDFQMLLEVVTRSPADEERCAVVFSEGSVKSA